MKKVLKAIFGDPTKKLLNELQRDVEAINKLESEFEKLTNEQLSGKTQEFKDRIQSGESLDDLLHETFATVREAAKRVLGQRHYDVQLIGGIVLHRGQIAEMKTGEGKTLTSTLATYTNALSGKGVHIVTPNDYLARRDCVWMGQVFHMLGLSVGCVQAQLQSFMYDPHYEVDESHKEGGDTGDEDSDRDKKRDETASFKVEMSYLKPCNRKESYNADITYGTNNEFGFDYLRDNMVMNKNQMVQRDLHYTIVDEIDSILIDEARTPLIISAPAEEPTDQYYEFAKLVATLDPEEDYSVDEKTRSSILTSEGIQKLEKALNVDNLYSGVGIKTVHHIENALKAHALFKRDKDYVVQENEIIIVDEFTGRMMYGRRYSEGLHQAIEAKEGVQIQRESETLATITFQNYFRMYEKLSGMTGTATTEAEEFGKIYGLEVFEIPTNKPIQRDDLEDRIYQSEKGKFKAVIEEIKDRREKGQPILVGTASIEKNELFSSMLEKAGVPHEMLNAKNHEREAQIIAQAGVPGAVTVATNMAGRGVDIVLGGNPIDPKLAQQVKDSGGLYVLATERHDARRIDNQLRGRSGRQGDPGLSQFYISLEDDLMRIFASERMQNIMKTFNFPEDMPIENKIVSKSLEQAQKKVESSNFDIRKHLLEYDDVLNRHRTAVYQKRRAILDSADSEGEVDREKLRDMIYEMIENEFERIVYYHTESEVEEKWDAKGIVDAAGAIMPVSEDLEEKLANLHTRSVDKEKIAKERGEAVDLLMSIAEQNYEGLEKQIEDPKHMAEVEKNAMLRAIDVLWVEHLVAITYLRQSIGLQGYGQRDPLIEYKKRAFVMFNDLMAAIESEIVTTIFKIGAATIQAKSLMERAGVTMAGAAKIMGAQDNIAPSAGAGKGVNKVGRNNPCPCGSGKKYKKCHG